MEVDFFRRAMEAEKRHREPGMSFLNTMQTNGTLLTDEWCAFFEQNDFLIGISIDGPRELHDVYRVNKRGEGSFDKVMRGPAATEAWRGIQRFDHRQSDQRGLSA